ncbi:glycosyltransferase family 2 protein [Geotalea sp. SG265]|uniref:glycosyltransferase family 2 protein n=1 Tax=Geotalea sp. SG265 TaxID=2922867 RepID=UPI001FAF3F8E|nr:glycosyltransferase family 2 protein [Geotalea sp. SG265]
MSAVDLLLATFNGEHYLGEQLVSLFAQTCQDWRMIISDDGSTDDTRAIIESCQTAHGNVTSLSSTDTTLGPCGNFARLLQHSTADYVMFCDQDDVWLPRKIEKTLAKMGEMEAHYGKEMPLLVHSDLKVVDCALQPLAPSFWRYHGTNPDAIAFNRLLVQNVATGCTVMINKPLRELALPIPAEARMHDWWLCLVAAAFGRIGYVNEPTVLYRQHGRNDSGAKPTGFGVALDKILNPSTLISRDDFDLQLQRQAAVFLQRFGDRLPPQQRELLGIYSRLREQGRLKEAYRRLKYGFLYSNWLMNMRMLLLR